MPSSAHSLPLPPEVFLSLVDHRCPYTATAEPRLRLTSEKQTKTSGFLRKPKGMFLKALGNLGKETRSCFFLLLRLGLSLAKTTDGHLWPLLGSEVLQRQGEQSYGSYMRISPISVVSWEVAEQSLYGFKKALYVFRVPAKRILFFSLVG